jgi:protein SCO1/2/putative membrane protein
MIDVHILPTVNATLNATSAILLVRGYLLIRSGRADPATRTAHKRIMLTAVAVSALFLISYLYYHAQVGSVRFQKEGLLRTVYLTILFTHTVLAATVPVLVIAAVRRALKGQFAKHVKTAKWLYPIWLYVSITGVVVYLMLYRF